jgi:N-methylhydantoinase B
MTLAPTTDLAAWDGRTLPYRPGEPLQISDNIALHTDDDAEIDPVTFEVLSTKLWNVNEEHADTIRRVSGSPIVVLVNDFNTCIMTETGDAFLFAPYIQYFASASEYIIKYTLENRSGSPGINPGDVFVHNDCFIAGSHQQDVGIYAPVFVDGKLFCWVFSACHVRDCGGTEPGGFCTNAPDIYSEPPMMRAMKIADRNGICADVEDTFLRMSRLPAMLALELRSQIAGANRARTRIEELVERYGPATVKRVMRKLIEDTERAARTRLERLPDGEWQDVVWASGAMTGDTKVYKHVLTLTKRGAELTFSNAGTDAQVASLNCSFGQFRSAILCALAQMLAFDHRYCVGGFANLVEYEADVGTISCVDRDGAFSALHAQLLTIYMANKVLARMAYPDPELRRMVMATSAVASRAWLSTWGTMKDGTPFASLSLDEVGGLGGFTFRDGVDQGGATFWPKLEIGDCESWEQYYPVLYLYRKGAQNCGHGKFRGGHGISVGWIGHGSPDQQFTAVSISPALPVQSGLFGGQWGQTGQFWTAAGTDLRRRFEDGVIPTSFDELHAAAPHGHDVQANATGLPLGDHDVVTQSLFGAGGYGDPLERDVERIQRDLDVGDIAARTATTVYGAVLGADGRIDAAATEQERARRRAQRLADASKPVDSRQLTTAGCEAVIDVAEHLAIAVDRATSEAYVICKCCEHALAKAEDNYKNGAAVWNSTLAQSNPELTHGAAVDEEVVYRSYLCPECGALLDSELTLANEPPVWDVRVATEAALDAVDARSEAMT